MRNTVKKIWNFINGVLMAAVLLFAAAIFGVRLFGLDLYVVLSGSMEPTYQTGSVIYVKEVKTAELKAGDVITFYLNGDTVATHRVIEVTEEAGDIAFRTKGDANDMADGSVVPASQVIGVPVFTIPKLGYLVSYMQSTSGRYAAVAVGAVLLLMIFLPDMIFGNDNKSKKETEE